MFDVFFGKASRLNEQGLPFALAVVVRYEAPSSGKTGDKAIILEDGAIEGWIGGGCTQPVVIQEARRALEEGKPRLIRIAPSNEDKTEGIVSFPMTCHSGGALDVYIEPVFPKPHLIVFGHSVVAQTLCRLARAIHYRVTAVAPDAGENVAFEADRVLNQWDLSDVHPTPQTFLVIATQGEGDEEALMQALAFEGSHVAFVASRKKAAAVFDSLEARGVNRTRLETVRSPAGLDIRARLPEEIAVSILAEIIREKREIRAERPVNPSIAMHNNLLSEHLDIEGMSCAHCVHTVEKTLKSLEGVDVESVEIGAADVRYDPTRIDRSAIVGAIRERGYEVKEIA